MDLALHCPAGVRSLMFLAAVVVAGTWAGARHWNHGEAYADAVARRVPAQQVQSISIDTPSSPREERRLPISELRTLLSTKTGDLLDDAKLETDRRALEDALVARGYLAAKVSPASVTFARSGGAYVVFDIDRGPMYRLRSVAVTGPGQLAAEVVTLSVGDEAIRARIARARQTLADALAHRLPKATVEVQVHEDRATATVDLELVTR